MAIFGPKPCVNPFGKMSIFLETAPPGLLPLLQMLKDGRLGMPLLLPLLQVAGAVQQSTVLLILLLRWNLSALPILLLKG